MRGWRRVKRVEWTDTVTYLDPEKAGQAPLPSLTLMEVEKTAPYYTTLMEYLSHGAFPPSVSPVRILMPSHPHRAKTYKGDETSSSAGPSSCNAAGSRRPQHGTQTRNHQCVVTNVVTDAISKLTEEVKSLKEMVAPKEVKNDPPKEVNNDTANEMFDDILMTDNLPVSTDEIVEDMHNKLEKELKHDRANDVLDDFVMSDTLPAVNDENVVDTEQVTTNSPRRSTRLVKRSHVLVSPYIQPKRVQKGKTLAIPPPTLPKSSASPPTLPKSSASPPTLPKSSASPPMLPKSSALLLDPYMSHGLSIIGFYYTRHFDQIGMNHRLFRQQMDKQFWDALFGQNVRKRGWLSGQHVNLWRRLLLERCPADARWTIMPSEFFDRQGSKDWTSFACGTGDYPDKSKAWWEVDKVYFAHRIPDFHWILGELTLDTMTVSIYDSLGSSSTYDKLQSTGEFKDFSMKVDYLLSCIDYWRRKSLKPMDVDLKYELVEGLPVQTGELGDCAVFVCMWMERLVCGWPLTIDEPADVVGRTFRHRMASIIWGSHLGQV